MVEKPVYVDRTKNGLQIGDKVEAIEFTNSSGHFVPRKTGLTVVRIRYIEGKSIPSYYRLYCEDESGMWVEGAERFFIPENIFEIKRFSHY